MEATCRFCGAKIVLRKIYEGAWRQEWALPGGPVNSLSDEASPTKCGRACHMPREYCNHRRTGDSQQCVKKVKAEDVMAGMFACGQHMRLEITAQAERAAAQEREEKAAEHQALLQWEAENYVSAVEELRGLFAGHDDLVRQFPRVDGIVRKSWNGKEIHRVEKLMEVNIIDLLDAVKGLVNAALEESNDRG
jgi:hypothetical protein